MCGARVCRCSRRLHSTYAAPRLSVYHLAVGTLRTSEEGASAAGEGRKAEAADDDRRVDGGAKIVIESGPITAAAALPAPVAKPRTPPRATPIVPAKRGGLGLVVVVYLLAASALGYAIYERYFL